MGGIDKIVVNILFEMKNGFSVKCWQRLVIEQIEFEYCIFFSLQLLQGFQLSIIESLPPGHYFSRFPAEHVKSPASMKKIPQAYKISRTSGKKTFKK